MFKENLSYKQFLLDTNLNEQSLWQSFYQLHESKIEIKNQSIAEKKLALILKATFKLSHDNGFALTSLRDLSRESKLSLGGIYSYIGNKEQLALMIHEFLPHMFESYLRLDELIDNKKLKPFQKLERVIKGHVYLTEFLRSWFFFAYMESKYASQAIKKIAIKNESKTQTLIFDLLSEVAPKNNNANLMLETMSIKALLQNWYLKHPVFKKNKITPEDYVSHILSLLNKGIFNE